MSFESLTNRSYVPYSNQPATCAVSGQSGTLYPGVRIENISFPLTIPAVRCGLYSCLSEGEQPETLYIDSPSDDSLGFWREEYGIRVAGPEELDSENFAVTTAGDMDILTLLSQGLDRSVVPNSGFPVAAVLLTGQGMVYGVNIEIEGPHWDLGLCAERVVLAKAIAAGLTDFKEMHVHTRRGDYSSPCGACRQVIVEHMPHHPVFIHHPDGTTSRHFSDDLLPYSFQSDYLRGLDDTLNGK